MAALKAAGRGEIGTAIPSELLGCDPVHRAVLQPPRSQAPSALLTEITDEGEERADLCWITLSIMKLVLKPFPKATNHSPSTSPSKLLLICLPCRAQTHLPKDWWISCGQHHSPHVPHPSTLQQLQEPILSSHPGSLSDTASSPLCHLPGREDVANSHPTAP